MEKHKELASLIVQNAKEDGVHATHVPRLFVARFSKPTEPRHGVHKASICFIAQGRKQVALGEQMFDYGAGQHLVVSVDLPVIGCVKEASADAPYLCLRLDLDLDLCAEMLLKYPAPRAEAGLGVAIGDTQPDLIDAAIRLLSLNDAPDHVGELAPLIEREIVYRLLQGPQGCCIRRVLQSENHHRHVGRAITWIKENYDRPIRIEDVASISGMSASSLHQHFREATTMSPLQYQKRLRLEEARRLIMIKSLDAASAGHSVGYDSPSQFSREYKRLFGAPPQRDIERLRQSPIAVGADA
jgi:AraC-like DNA-binding protein